jgi:hypothetical protein
MAGLMRRALIDDPESQEPAPKRIESILRLGGSDGLEPVRNKARPTIWDVEYAELLERQQREWLKS